jgi:hypothetical protein
MKLKFLVGVAVVVGSMASGTAYAQDVSATTRAARTDALAALKAVESAVNAGANIETFKQYQIAAAVKVDALPWGPETAPLKVVAQTYAEVGSLFTAWLTKTMSSREVYYFQTKYPFSYPLWNLPVSGFDNRPLGPVKHPVGVYLVAPSTRAESEHEKQSDFAADLARLGAEELLALASTQLRDLK